MSARLQEQSEWNSKFVRGLEGPYKTFWFWLKSACDHGGVWEVDIEMAKMITGQQLITQEGAELFFKSKITVVCDGDKWLLNDFCEEQFKTRELNEANTYHRGAIRILEKVGAFKNKIYTLKEQKQKPLYSGSEATKEKEKIKYKEKTIEIESFLPREEIEVDEPKQPKQPKKSKEKPEQKTFLTPFVQAFRDFKEMRVKIRKPLTERAIGMIHTELEKLAPGNDDVKILILNQSVMNSWPGVFPLKIKSVPIAQATTSKTENIINIATAAQYQEPA